MRRQFYFAVFTVLIIFSFFACGGGKNKTQSNNDSSYTKVSEKENEKLPENPLFLEGIYATSVNLPDEKYNTDKLFDENKGYWSTMPGAGPDEGIMLYFPKNTEIGKVEVKFTDDSALEKILKIGLYVNGADVKTLSPENNSFSDFENTVSSIFFRIIKTDKIKSSKPVEVAYVLSTFTKSFNSDKAVGIDEIIIYDKEGKKFNVLPPKKYIASIIASSTLEPVSAYNPEFLFDSRFDYGWAEGNPENNGKNENITLTFNEEVSVTKLKFWNGFQRSKSHFQSNARVKKFSFGLKGETASVYELKDSESPQEIALSKSLTGKTFILKIEDVYAGSKYQDLVISELRLFNGLRWFIPTSSNIEKDKQKLIEKVKGSILEKMIDKWIYEEIVEDDYLVTNQSVIFRSNQSFVIWYQETNKDASDGFAKQTVMDGNWDIISMDKTSAKIKIFGKRKILNKGFGTYKGVEEEANTIIFSDVLTISPKLVKGEKFFDSIKNFLSE